VPQVLSALEPDEADLEEIRSLDNPELLISRAEQSAQEELQAATHALRILEATRRQVWLEKRVAGKQLQDRACLPGTMLLSLMVTAHALAFACDLTQVDAAEARFVGRRTGPGGSGLAVEDRLVLARLLRQDAAELHERELRRPPGYVTPEREEEEEEQDRLQQQAAQLAQLQQAAAAAAAAALARGQVGAVTAARQGSLPPQAAGLQGQGQPQQQQQQVQGQQQAPGAQQQPATAADAIALLAQQQAQEQQQQQQGVAGGEESGGVEEEEEHEGEEGEGEEGDEGEEGMEDGEGEEEEEEEQVCLGEWRS
jgi:hypothetical protein